MSTRPPAETIESISVAYDILASKYRRKEGAEECWLRNQARVIAEIEAIIASRDALLDAAEEMLKFRDNSTPIYPWSEAVAGLRKAIAGAKGEKP